MKTSKNFYVLTLIAAAVLCGCTVGPNYRRASALGAAHWDVAEPWRESAPKDALGKGEWWAVFNDEELNALQKEALASNQTLKISVARLEQARALAGSSVRRYTRTKPPLQPAP